jgi:hypothetical protein
MIILHKAQRTDGEGEVKGFITKMWGEYHIISESDENIAYPVLEVTIKPCLPIEGELIELETTKGSMFDPMKFDKLDMTNEQIIETVQNVVQLHEILNQHYELKDILEQVCLKNDLNLSDNDKRDILKHFKDNNSDSIIVQ